MIAAVEANAGSTARHLIRRFVVQGEKPFLVGYLNEFNTGEPRLLLLCNSLAALPFIKRKFLGEMKCQHANVPRQFMGATESKPQGILQFFDVGVMIAADLS